MVQIGKLPPSILQSMHEQASLHTRLAAGKLSPDPSTLSETNWNMSPTMCVCSTRTNPNCFMVVSLWGLRTCTGTKLNISTIKPASPSDQDRLILKTQSHGATKYWGVSMPTVRRYISDTDNTKLGVLLYAWQQIGITGSETLVLNKKKGGHRASCRMSTGTRI